MSVPRRFICIIHHGINFSVNFYCGFDSYWCIFCDLRVILWNHYPDREYYSKATICVLYICFKPLWSLYRFTSGKALYPLMNMLSYLHNNSPSSPKLPLPSIFSSWKCKDIAFLGCSDAVCSSIPRVVQNCVFGQFLPAEGIRTLYSFIYFL